MRSDKQKAMTDANKTDQKVVDIFTLGEVAVTLTYTGFGAPPITFFLRPCLTDEEQALRQTQLTKPDKEREAGKHTHNVEMLALLSVREPEGIANFAGDIRTHFALETQKGDAQTTTRNLMKRKVASDALTRYLTITQPAEFFRSV